MGVYETTTKSYVCDRCGETVQRDHTAPLAPVDWMQQSCISLLSNTVLHDATLCPECVGWLGKFLQGRKVVD